VHVFGTGIGNTGNFVNDKMLNIQHVSDYLKFKMYLKAANVEDLKSVDQDYIERLIDLAHRTPFHGKYSILAFDKNYNPDGTVNLSKTEFYVPNEYVFALAEKYPDLFIPVMSVHPYRKDALEELTKFAHKGGEIVKWLPNAMGIDPSDPKCDLFYAKMKELHLILLSHAGEELAVEAKDDQKYGNPQLLKKPLDMGIKVIIAHCASLGESADLDNPSGRKANNFDLFLRLMETKKYEGLLFADISALTQINRSGKPLKTMLHRTDLQHRLVNGSDYPLPAVDLVISLDKLVLLKYITKQESDYLREIYKYNPLLFDFVLKRTLKDPETGSRFNISVFMINRGLDY
jgi:predicted TIM-barrel fold metal-dependent hydrolase